MYEDYAFGPGTMRGDQPPLVPALNARSRPHDELLEWMREGHRRWLGSVRSLPDDVELDHERLTNWGDYLPTRNLIRIMIGHDFYHAGEINKPAHCCRGPIDGRTDSVVLAPGGARRDAAGRVAEQLTGPCPTLSKGVAFADDLRSDSAADGGRYVARTCNSAGHHGAGKRRIALRPGRRRGSARPRWGRGVVDPRWRVPNHDCLLRRLSRLSVANGAAQQPSRKRPG